MNKFGPWMNWNAFFFQRSSSLYDHFHWDYVQRRWTKCSSNRKCSEKLRFHLGSNGITLSVASARTCLLCGVWSRLWCSRIICFGFVPSPHSALEMKTDLHIRNTMVRSSKKVVLMRERNQNKVSRWFIRCNRPYACVVRICVALPSGLALLWPRQIIWQLAFSCVVRN